MKTYSQIIKQIITGDSFFDLEKECPSHLKRKSFRNRVFLGVAEAGKLHLINCNLIDRFFDPDAEDIFGGTLLKKAALSGQLGLLSKYVVSPENLSKMTGAPGSETSAAYVALVKQNPMASRNFHSIGVKDVASCVLLGGLPESSWEHYIPEVQVITRPESVAWTRDFVHKSLIMRLQQEVNRPVNTNISKA